MSLGDLQAALAELEASDLAQLFAGQEGEFLRAVAAAALAHDRGGGWTVVPRDLLSLSEEPLRREEDGVVFEAGRIEASIIRRHECPGCSFCQVEFSQERFVVWEGVGRLNFPE